MFVRSPQTGNYIQISGLLKVNAYKILKLFDPTNTISVLAEELIKRTHFVLAKELEQLLKDSVHHQQFC